MQNKIMKLLLTVIATLAVIYGTYSVVTVEVPYLKNTVTSGTTIKGTDIELKRVLKSKTSKNQVTDAFSVIGKETTVAIAGGQPIYIESLKEKITTNTNTEATVTANQTIIYVPVSYTRVTSDLKQNDLVSVLFTFKEGSLDGVTRTTTLPFPDTVTVKKVVKDGEQHIVAVELIIDKEDIVDVTTAIQTSEVSLIKNYADNNIKLQGSSANDLYTKYYRSSTVTPSRTNDVEVQ